MILHGVKALVSGNKDEELNGYNVEIAYVGKKEGFVQCSTEQIESYLQRAETVSIFLAS